jgi:hypothetical protein
MDTTVVLAEIFPQGLEDAAFAIYDSEAVHRRSPPGLCRSHSIDRRQDENATSRPKVRH